jgi:hypothetical protein
VPGKGVGYSTWDGREGGRDKLKEEGVEGTG